ncbi:hypothetical protein VTL71DRAFT_9009 [Oculimacula yallundae]|uniref:Uncharacterized protein n=1 Tax=Oculimacula yallundae TaxID=86028 RepID=A0ABR4BTI0_9HELO
MTSSSTQQTLERIQAASFLGISTVLPAETATLPADTTAAPTRPTREGWEAILKDEYVRFCLDKPDAALEFDISISSEDPQTEDTEDSVTTEDSKDSQNSENTGGTEYAENSENFEDSGHSEDSEDSALGKLRQKPWWDLVEKYGWNENDDEAERVRKRKCYEVEYDTIYGDGGGLE